MKKLIYTLLAFATVCFSCVQDVDDVYDKPVAQRVEEAVQEYHDLLVSSRARVVMGVLSAFFADIWWFQLHYEV